MYSNIEIILVTRGIEITDDAMISTPDLKTTIQPSVQDCQDMEHVIDVAEVVVQVPAFLCGPVLCGNPVVYGGRTAENQ